MGTDQAQPRRIPTLLTPTLRHGFGDVLMIDSVEAEAAEPLTAKFLRDCIAVGGLERLIRRNVAATCHRLTPLAASRAVLTLELPRLMTRQSAVIHPRHR